MLISSEKTQKEHVLVKGHSPPRPLPLPAPVMRSCLTLLGFYCISIRYQYACHTFCSDIIRSGPLFRFCITPSPLSCVFLLSLTLYLPPSSLTLSLSLALTSSLSPRLTLNISLSLSLYVSLAFPVFISLILYLSLSFPQSLCVFLFLYLYIYFFLCLSFSFSLSLSFH
jgi:hypothetical protein